jgi:hypothetical protein
MMVSVSDINLLSDIDLSHAVGLCYAATHALSFGKPFRQLDQDPPIARIRDFIESDDQP